MIERSVNSAKVDIKTCSLSFVLGNHGF